MEQIKCPGCSSRLNLPADAIDREVKCPRCAEVFVAALTMTVGYVPPKQTPEEVVRLVGTRVLAPWEPEYFYPGTVAEADGEAVLVEFDDGDRAYRYATDLRPIRVEKGDVVFCRRDRSVKSYTPATATAVDGEDVEVVYADGFREWTRVEFLRFARTA